MVNKILMTGATGYIANQLLPTFRENYEMVLVDVNGVNRNGDRVEGVEIADLIDPDRSKYAHLFKGVDAVVHLGYKRRTADNPLDHFAEEKQNVEMAYNVLRSAYDAGVPRVVIASSNHASDWYEHALIHRRQMEVLDPYTLPLSDNFYGWAKATYEHMGFLFACGGMGFGSSSGGEDHTGGSQSDQRRMGVVMVRIGAPPTSFWRATTATPPTTNATWERTSAPATSLNFSPRRRRLPTSRTSTASRGWWSMALATTLAPSGR